MLKKRKVTFADSSAQPPALHPDSIYGEETHAQVPLYNPTATPQDRLYRFLNKMDPPTTTRTIPVTIHQPCENHPKDGPPPAKIPMNSNFKGYLRGRYQQFLQYAEPPNVFLTDFESSSYTNNTNQP